MNTFLVHNGGMTVAQRDLPRITSNFEALQSRKFLFGGGGGGGGGGGKL